MSEPTSIPGRCHCGNLTFELDWRGDPAEIPARACGCSFCLRHGNVWTSHPGSRLIVAVGDAALLARYAFGTGTATFHLCGRCGVVPVATSEIEGRVYAVVNVNTFEGVEASRLLRASADFEGEETGARLARRKKSWIADVQGLR